MLTEAFEDGRPDVVADHHPERPGQRRDVQSPTPRRTITAGAKVSAIDPEDSGAGAQVGAATPQPHGVKVIDYDRLTLGGAATATTSSFNNVNVGNAARQGPRVSCVKAWKVASPKVIVMRGAPTDNNATLFAQGY